MQECEMVHVWMPNCGGNQVNKLQLYHSWQQKNLKILLLIIVQCIAGWALWIKQYGFAQTQAK